MGGFFIFVLFLQWEEWWRWSSGLCLEEPLAVMDTGCRIPGTSLLVVVEQLVRSAVLGEWSGLYTHPAVTQEALDCALNWIVFPWRKTKDEPFQMRSDAN